jgi:hypothetical protein
MMLLDRPQSYYIFAYHSLIPEGYDYVTYQEKHLTNKEYLEHWGKWLVDGLRRALDELARKLDTHVEAGDIACIKYERKPRTDLGKDLCTMCVYCDERCRDDVLQIILANGGWKPRTWRYDRETINKWLPGGKLLEHWIQSEKLSDAEAAKVRGDSHKKFSVILDHPDNPFAGWPQ